MTSLSQAEKPYLLLLAFPYLPLHPIIDFIVLRIIVAEILAFSMQLVTDWRRKLA